MTKSVTNKLGKKAKTKHCGQLIQSIHVQICNGDAQLLTDKYNCTTFIYMQNILFPKCLHPEEESAISYSITQCNVILTSTHATMHD